MSGMVHAMRQAAKGKVMVCAKLTERSGGTGNFGEGSRLLAAEGTAKQDMAGAATRPAPEKEGKGATSAHVDDRAGSGGPCLGVDGDGGGRAASDYPKGASGTAGRRAT
eukprot:scaffold1427_cov20-Tisochrysis_lutea.AAC.1